MRKIQKKISLEPMTSRLPSILPAYMNNQLYFFDDTNLKKRDYTYTSNYGMIPMNVDLSGYSGSIPCLDNNECLTCSGTSAYTYTPVIEREDKCDQDPSTRREGCELCQCRIISFERLSIWYNKFTEYYHLLNDYSHCNTVYSSAVEYYYNEGGLINPNHVTSVTRSGNNITLKGNGYTITTVNGKAYIPNGNELNATPTISNNSLVITYKSSHDSSSTGTTTVPLGNVLKERNGSLEDLYYGNDLQTYIDLDNEIKCMGGRPTTSSITITTDCNGNTTPKSYQTVDKGFYEWICENVVPTYPMPKEYQDYWQRQTLYYPDVIKWIGWFKERYGKYGVNPDCKTEEGDCCDCTEYVNRGGYNMIDEDNEDSMVFWYNKIQNNIISSLPKDTYACVDIVHYNCYEPFYIMPIELQNSIEDLGEFTIFCEEYKAGIDYRTIPTESAETKTIIHFESGNTHSGTTVLKDGVPQQLVSGMGYTYDDKYMEILPDDDGWKIPNTNIVTSSLTALASSKVQSLHIDNHLVDDIGNPIEGLYDTTDKANHQPPEGSILQPIYQVGHKYNMVRNEEVDNQFIGDEIDNMEFYYMCLDGTPTTPQKAEKDDALGAIERASIPDNDKPYYEDIFCDITYHIGNIYVMYEKEEEDVEGEIKKVKQIRLATEELDGFDGHGVEYIDTVQFVKTRTEYYLKKMSKDYAPDEKKVASAHTLSYPIYVYNLKRGEDEIVDNTYDTTYNDSLSKVSYEVKRRFLEEDEYHEIINPDSNSPIIREEYRLGIAGPESVEGDIYIDRGINSAFEKHLKLGEVTSLESLLQYGNGYFKIMEN